MKKQLMKKLSTCLPVGMALITMVMFSAIAKAQIVYTDVIPDTTINTNGGVYNLDLNNDSVTDFRITYTTSTVTLSRCGSATKINIQITPLDSNAVGNGASYPRALDLNAVIDSGSHVWRKNSNQILASLDWTCVGTGRYPWVRYSLRSTINGNWNGKNDKYLPLLLNLKSQKYYGWVRLDVASSVASFTVKDYAYNTKPNQLILAGDTSCTAPSVSLSASGPLSICKGDWVQFNATSNPSYIYQWFKDGIAISGADSSFYKAYSAGAYYVQVNNSCGHAKSLVDTVSVYAVDTSVTVSGDTLMANVTSATYQWMDCSTNQIISGATAQTFLPSQSGSFAVIVTQKGCSDTSSCYTVCIAPTVQITSSGSLSICRGDGVQLNATKGFAYQYQWFKDGNAISGADSSTYTAYSAGAYYVQVNNGCGNAKSLVDTVSVFAVDTSVTVSGDTFTANAASATYQWMDCSTNQIIPGATAQKYSPSQNGSFAVIVTQNSCSDTSSCYTACFPPTVSVAPGGPLTICNGDGVQLNATTGFAYLYQWFKDGVAISGARSPFYTAYSAGGYSVKVSNNCGNVQSEVDTVSVFAVDTSVTVKGNVFTANAAGATYQWMDCITNQIIPGATAQTYSPSQNGSFAVIVTQNGCSDTSSCYTACFPPTVSVALSGPLTICNGDWVQFNATTGFSYQYQWFKDGNAISGEDSSSYTAFSAGAYYVKVSNDCGYVNSEVDTVSIFSFDTSVTIKGNVFTANAASATYQWIDCSTMQNIPGATARTFSPTQNGSFAVIVTENGCSNISSCFTFCLTPTASFAAGGPLTICRGDGVQLNATTGFSYQYQWFKDGNAISGADSPSYIAFSAGAYYVKVSNGCGNVNSAVDTVSIFAVNTSVTVSGKTLTASAASAIYQWMDCATMQIIPGETAQTYTSSQNGSFAVIVTEKGCSDTSSCYSTISTWIDENVLASSISVYPNPASNQITIDLGSNQQNVGVTITDMTGKVMYSTMAGETQKIEVSTDFFNKGVYVVRIQGAKEIVTKKLIVEK